MASADETTALRGEKTRSNAHSKVVRVAYALGGVALVGVGVASTASGRNTMARFGAWAGVNGKLLPRQPEAGELAGVKRATTFKIYTQCKPDAVKRAGGNFWFSPLKAASIVKHNFGSDDFFNENNGIAMERAELADGVYGYKVTTNQVDWEWGVQLENMKGEYWKEIGTLASPTSPLAEAECVQMYGDYYNRVLTHETNPYEVSYVIGSCDKECPSGLRDSAYCRQPFTGVVGTTEATGVDLGHVDDARLVNFASALMYGDVSVINPSGRAETFRYNDGSPTEQLWIVATGDYSREFVKMVQVKVVVNSVSQTGKAFVTGARFYRFSTTDGYAYDHWSTPPSNRDGCKMGYCNVARYDVRKFWDKGTAQSGLNIQRLEFNKLSLGDAPPTPYNNVYDGAFLFTSNQQILAPGQWGEDMDVRRVILKNGVLCGGSIAFSNCMFGKAFPVDPAKVSDYSGPTKTKKQWMVIVIEDVFFKMVRVEISLNANKGVDARVIDAGYVYHPRTADVLTSDSMSINGSEKWAQRNGMPAAADVNGGGYGLGGFKFDLAAEMSTSLRGISC